MKFIIKNDICKTDILSLLSIFGVGTSCALSYRAAKKEKTTIKDKINAYAPPIISAVGTSALIACTQMENRKIQVGLVGAYSALSTIKNKYEKAIIKKEGEQYFYDLEKDIYNTDPIDITASGGTFSAYYIPDKPTENDTLCYDTLSKKYFYSNIPSILDAEYHLNRNYALAGAMLLRQFYNYLGMDERFMHDFPEELSEGNVGWTMNDGIYWIDFHNFFADDEKYGKVLVVMPMRTPRLLLPEECSFLDVLDPENTIITQVTEYACSFPKE